MHQNGSQGLHKRNEEMVTVKFDKNLQKTISKIKDNSVKSSIQNKIQKIIENSEIGKPMRYARKGTGEVYLGSFRLSYRYYPNEELLEFLDLYHKDEQ
jgi:mRNA-degrading endonuclease RelE of RelBE toxin-antitoxin system